MTYNSYQENRGEAVKNTKFTSFLSIHSFILPPVEIDQTFLLGGNVVRQRERKGGTFPPRRGRVP